MIVIGSEAIGEYLHAFRKSNDLDLVGTYEEIDAYRKKINPACFFPINSGKTLFMKTRQGRIIEAEIAWPDSMAERLIDFVMNEPDTKKWNEDWYTPSLDVLYMLKMSHRYLKNSPHFLKTMDDIHFLRNCGCEIRPSYMDFYKQRMKDTYAYKHPKLNVNKDGFFDNNMTGVYQKYDHDSIHRAIAELDKPAYEYFKPDNSEVMVSKEMWDKLDYATKIFAVLEESYVLALERSLIPFPNGKTPKEAFDMALMKVCTSITSGWFREFAWENYHVVQTYYSDNFVSKFERGVADGIVILNKENSGV